MRPQSARASKNRKVTGYLVMQCIKESSTLRLGNKGAKSSPRIVYRFGRQDSEIENYLRFRRLIHDINIVRQGSSVAGSKQSF